MNAKDRYTMDDVVAGILSLTGMSEKTTHLQGRAQEFHPAFCQLRNSHPVLEGLPFSLGESFRFSRYLERILSRMTVAMLLKMDWPGYKHYLVTARAKRTITRIVHPCFTAQELDELQEIANELTELLAVAVED